MKCPYRPKIAIVRQQREFSVKKLGNSDRVCERYTGLGTYCKKRQISTRLTYLTRREFVRVLSTMNCVEINNKYDDWNNKVGLIVGMHASSLCPYESTAFA